MGKTDPRSTEKICAYASGKFPVPKPTIDAEIHAVMETMKVLKIHYLDRKELLIRTDCQAIIAFYNKSSEHKPSRVRWIAFTDFITGMGIPVLFEHIDGKQNILADALSRLVCRVTEWSKHEEEMTVIGAALHELARAQQQGKDITPQVQEYCSLLALILTRWEHMPTTSTEQHQKMQREELSASRKCSSTRD